MDESERTKAARAKAIAAKKAASSVTGAPGAYHTPRPTNDESNWPRRDPNGYIFLGRAAHELALLQYQARWAELDPQQRESVEDQIIAACESGAVSSFYKSPGGETKKLAPSLWNADDIESVFVEFTIEIEGARIGDSCLPVFLSKKDWDLLKAAPVAIRGGADAGTSTSGSSRTISSETIANKIIENYRKAASAQDLPPTLDGCEEFADSQGYHGGRNLLRKAWRDLYPTRRGRPKKIAK
jgi:hypothetical protein